MKKNLFFCILILMAIQTAKIFSFDFNSLVINKEMLQSSQGKYILVVSKSNYLISVLNKENYKIEAQYPVSLGINPGRKIVRGDQKTPEGIYYIQEILSQDAPVNSYSYKELKRMNQLYWKAKDGHFKYGRPKVDLGNNAYGPRVFKLNYPNDEDKKYFYQLKKDLKIPASAQLEKWIGIHGTNDPASIQKNASSGCVRLLNHDLEKLSGFIEIKTLVLIVP